MCANRGLCVLQMSAEVRRKFERNWPTRGGLFPRSNRQRREQPPWRQNLHHRTPTSHTARDALPRGEARQSCTGKRPRTSQKLAEEAVQFKGAEYDALRVARQVAARHAPMRGPVLTSCGACTGDLGSVWGDTGRLSEVRDNRPCVPNKVPVAIPASSEVVEQKTRRVARKLSKQGPGHHVSTEVRQ